MLMNKICVKRLSDKESGHIVGFFVGDGYPNYNKKDRHYKVEFYLNSKNDSEIIKYLNSLALELRTPFLIKKDKRYHCTIIKINSKSFMSILDSLKEDFLCGKNGYNWNYFLGLISGFIDAEGYVGNGEIQISQKNKNILLCFMKLCNLLKIQTLKFWSSKNFRSKALIWRLRITTKFKNLPTFHKKYLVYVRGHMLLNHSEFI